MSCKSCGKPIDEHMAKMRARLAARFDPDKPIPIPTRCSECAWKSILKFGEEGPSPSVMAEIEGEQT